MSFWIVLAACATLAALWIARPFLRNAPADLTGADGAISIYRDQLAEVDRDRKAALISQSECDAAQAEIERRALHAARSFGRDTAVSTRSGGSALALTAAVATLALGLYLALGAPETPDRPLASRAGENPTRAALAADVQNGISQLEKRTKQNKDSFDDWWALAQAYAMVGDHAASAKAYRTATDLAGDMPEVLSAYAEALVFANENKVPEAARVIFDQLARTTDDPRAHYYAALAKFEAQDYQGALEGWSKLAKSSPADAPWMPTLKSEIIEIAEILKVDPGPYLPEQTTETAPAGMIDDMVTSLANRLQNDPNDLKGWVMLVRSYATLGQHQQARAAFETAIATFDDDPNALDFLNKTAGAMLSN